MLNLDELERRDYLLEMELMLLRREHEQAERDVDGKRQRLAFLKQVLESGRSVLDARLETDQGDSCSTYTGNLTRLEQALEQAEESLRRAQEGVSKLARQVRAIELGRGLLSLERTPSNS
jgi:uncharacterized protein YukE